MQHQNVHISDIRSFRQCRRKWNWSSGLRENLEPSIPYAPFFTGRAIHHCLEHYYRSGTDIWQSLDEFMTNEKTIAGNMWAQEQQTWDEQTTMIAEILRHYMLWIQVDTSDFRDENLEFIELEVPFEVPMRDPVTGVVSSAFGLAGRFDGLVRHKPTNTYWIWECKTTRSIGELARSLDNDEQAGAYIYAAQELKHVEVSGVLYNMLRKKAPTHPGELTNGFLSKNKKIDTTPFAYVADIKRHHGDVDWSFIQTNYGDLLSNMSIGNNGFFARFPVMRNKHEIKMLIDNLYWTAEEMTTPYIPTYPAPNWLNCNFCVFRAPCLAMNKGGDFQSLLEAEFQTRTRAESLREVEDEKSES